MPRTRLILLGLALFTALASSARAEGPTTAPTKPIPSISEAIARGVEFLKKDQSPDGSWGTGRETRGLEIDSMVPGSLDAFRLGASSLCVMALREVGEKEAHDKGLHYLLTAPDAKRDDGELIYNTWAHIYLVQALSEEILHGNKDPRIVEVAKRNLKAMVDYATYLGGWNYYDFGAHSQLVSLGPTSFGTAAGLVSLFEAKEAGLDVPEELIKHSLYQLEKMKLPNGVFLYGSDYLYIPTLPANRVRGAFGRTQPANYALWLWKSKSVDHDQIIAGLDLFFKEHKFLDMGRKRPWPHESWYQTSGYYYYFDHYYASRLLEALDAGPQKTEFAKELAYHVLAHQEDDGSWWDYAMWDFHKPYGTAFSIMTLLRCEQPMFTFGREDRRIVFLIDASGSMLTKMPTLKHEVTRAVNGLGADQSFDIMAIEGARTESLNKTMLDTSRESKHRAEMFLDGISSTGPSDYIPAIQAAFAVKPDAIFFVTDSADFPDPKAVVKTIEAVNADHKVRFNAILFVEDAVERKQNQDSEQLMQQIAHENGGTFKWVEIESIHP